MKDSGWIKLHRKIQEWELYFSEPFTKTQAWIDLILLANHQKKSITIRGNIVDVDKGEIGWSEENLGERWKWSRGKVRRFLEWLETRQQIVQQKSAVLSKIKITNYKNYQLNDTSDSTTDGQQTVQQTDINKNVKKEKKEKNTERPAPSEKGNDLTPNTGKTDEEATAIVQVLDAFKKAFNPTLNFANITEREAARSLVRAHGIDQVLKAIAFAESVKDDPFTPSVFKPTDLQKKWPNLVKAKQRKLSPPDEREARSGARKLHDGTEAIMLNGKWVDAQNVSVAIDLSYYPELTK